VRGFFFVVNFSSMSLMYIRALTEFLDFAPPDNGGAFSCGLLQTGNQIRAAFWYVAAQPREVLGGRQGRGRQLPGALFQFQGCSCRSVSTLACRQVRVPSRSLISAIDPRTLDRHPLASVGTLVLGLRCSWCPGSAPMPKLLGLYALPPARGAGIAG
jgi:hypothetical protein